MDIALFPLIFKDHLRLLVDPLGVFTAEIMLIWTVPYILALLEPGLQLRIPRDCHIADPVVCHFFGALASWETTKQMLICLEGKCDPDYPCLQEEDYVD